jgi:hypothetical protein
MYRKIAPHWSEQSHWLQSLSRRPRFRRFVLSEGYARLIKTAQDYETPIRIVEAVLVVNETRKMTDQGRPRAVRDCETRAQILRSSTADI